MQTEILMISAIVLFLVILISVISNFLKPNLEGLETQTTTTTTDPIYQPIVTAQQIQQAAATILNQLNMKDNKADYEDIINALLNYYDNLSVKTIINSKQYPNGAYNIDAIHGHKMIRDALTDTLEYLKTA